MKSELIVTAAVSGASGAFLQFLFSKFVWPNRHRTYTWLYALRNHRKFGAPCEADIVLDRRGYSLGFSKKRKSALWVSYIISKGSIGVDVERSEQFFPDFEIPEPYRRYPDDYTNSGYDKGHLVPSAAVDFSRRSNNETFLMTNVIPQDPKLNRQAWRSLERLERTWTSLHGALLIVSGPMYGKRNRRVGDLSVPKGFYKIIYAIEAEKCIGFVLPNKPATASELWKFAKSVQEVEEETGYTFLKILGSDAWDMKAQLDTDWWKEDAD